MSTIYFQTQIDSSNKLNADFIDTTASTAKTVTEAEKTIWNAKEDPTNKVTEISSSSTDTQYPSAKAVYTAVDGVKAAVISDTEPIGAAIGTVWIDTSTTGDQPQDVDAAISAHNTSAASHTDIRTEVAGKQTANLVTEITAESDDDHYPSTKAVYDDTYAPLDTRINNLQNIGRFLSLWNCTTGRPTTEPSSTPYNYKTGDYYRISVVGTTNYKPDGSSYSGTALRSWTGILGNSITEMKVHSNIFH